jgi:hypothetical protein
VRRFRDLFVGETPHRIVPAESAVLETVRACAAVLQGEAMPVVDVADSDVEAVADSATVLVVMAAGLAIDLAVVNGMTPDELLADYWSTACSWYTEMS